MSEKLRIKSNFSGLEDDEVRYTESSNTSPVDHEDHIQENQK